MANLRTGETHLTIYYRIDFENGERYVFSAEPLSPEVARDVLGSVTEDYTMVTPLYPKAKPQPFLSGTFASVEFIIEKTGLDERTASLLRSILSPLTLLAPGDFIVEQAEKWFSEHSQPNLF